MRSRCKGMPFAFHTPLFEPGKIKGGTFVVDIGTAGSISLFLQCLMPAIMHAPGTIRIKITGGTDVQWSPSIDYMRFVTLGALKKMGYECETQSSPERLLSTGRRVR